MAYWHISLLFFVRSSGEWSSCTHHCIVNVGYTFFGGGGVVLFYPPHKLAQHYCCCDAAAASARYSAGVLCVARSLQTHSSRTKYILLCLCLFVPMKKTHKKRQRTAIYGFLVTQRSVIDVASSTSTVAATAIMIYASRSHAQNTPQTHRHMLLVRLITQMDCPKLEDSWCGAWALRTRVCFARLRCARTYL